MSNPASPTPVRSATTQSGSPPVAPKPGHVAHQSPEQPYQTKKGCLIMMAVFGGLIALAVGAMLVTGMLSDK